MNIGRQSLPANTPSSPASAPAPAPAPRQSPTTPPIHRGRSGLFRSLNPVEELFSSPGEYDGLLDLPPEVMNRERYNIDVRQQGGASTAMVVSRQNVGRNYFQNRALGRDYSIQRAVNRGLASSLEGSNLMRTPDTPSPESGIQPRPRTQQMPPNDRASQDLNDAFLQFGLDDEMDGKGILDDIRNAFKPKNIAKAFKPVTRFADKTGVTKFVTKTLPKTLIEKGVPMAAEFVGSKFGVGKQARALGERGAKELKKVSGLGLKKGSPEMKAHMAKLRAMRKKK